MSKNVQQGTGKSIIPSAFKIKSITLSRYDDEPQADVQIHPLVTKVTINESLYTNSLIAEISVKDTVNLLGKFPIVGLEKLVIKIETNLIGTSEVKEISLPFHVTDVPTFGRGNEPNVQAYTLSCISPHVYISSLKQISRTFNGNLQEEILKILNQDLKFTGDVYLSSEEKCVSAAKGIITTRSPLQAMEFFRKRCSDNSGAPFYLYQSIDGNMYFVSLRELIKKDVYNTYVDGRGFKTEAQSLEDFEERRKRIIDVKSELELSKITQAKQGMFASRNNYLDTSNKTFETHKFARKDTGTFTSSFKVQDKGFSEYDEVFDVYIPTNKLAFNDTLTEINVNSNNIRKKRAHTLRSFAANLHTQTHDLVLNGDLYMNPGRLINLKFPKAIDPQERKDNEDYDELLSGNHLVTEVNHRFENDEYYINVVAKKV